MAREFRVRSFFTPCPEPVVVNPVFPSVFTPDNRQVETLLDAGDDVLPNTLNLMKNPMYATALQDFASYVKSSSPDLSGLTEDELFDSVSNNKDLNTAFWEFIDNAKQYKELRNLKRA